MVGRELPDTICPLGEDHQGHDWGGKTTEVETDGRGSNTTSGLRSLIRIMRLITAFSWTIVVMRQSGLLRMNCDLLV